ncbi:MAG: D-aminoacyl-tRNA deacylase [Nitrospirota bacterium]
MRVVIQRVREASVEINKEEVGRIGNGLVVLLGVAKGDSLSDIEYLAEKICNLRIFEDEEGKLNLSLLDKEGDLLVISEFTLLGNTRKGRRPGFDDASHPDEARKLYESFVTVLRDKGIKVKTGEFGSKMLVKMYNDGPVTFIIDSR